MPWVGSTDSMAGVNKKPKTFKTVWHGFRGILKLSGRVNQAKLQSACSITVCNPNFCLLNEKFFKTISQG